MGCMLIKIFRRATNISPSEAIKKLNDVENIIMKMIEKYETNRHTIQKQAREFAVQGKKDQAKILLKKNKILHRQILVLSNRLLAIQSQKIKIESLGVMKMEVEAMQQTAGAFKTFSKDTDIEKVEKLKNELADLIDDTCELSNIISEDLTMMDDDDEEIEREVENMISANEIQQAFPQHFPEVPQHSLQSEKQKLLKTKVSLF